MTALLCARWPGHPPVPLGRTRKVLVACSGAPARVTSTSADPRATPTVSRRRGTHLRRPSPTGTATGPARGGHGGVHRRH